MNSGMVIARVTASTKRRRRGTHQMYRAAPEDSLKAAESSLRLHRRRSLTTIVVGGLLSILLPTLVALPAAVYRVAERLRNPDGGVDRRAARPRGTCATPRSGRNGETNAKGRAAAHGALHGHLAAVVLDDGTGNGQPRPKPRLSVALATRPR